MTTRQETGIPERSWKFWGILFLLFWGVIALTMLKDWWLTQQEPDVAFYIIVPFMSILGGVLGMYAVAKIWKKEISFLTLLAIYMGLNILMQVVEIIMKVLYYRIWAYPGLLYIIIVIPLSILLLIYGLMRWGKADLGVAAVLALTSLLTDMIFVVFITNVIGITTPGS